MRARPDVRLAATFLCTQVKEPTACDWFKLTRMMNFLKAAAADCLIVEMDGSGKAVYSVEAACAVHPDARSHSGMSMKMGKGAITSLSRKQKLDTRSSMEAEIVAVYDCMSRVPWTKHFLEDLECPTEAIIVQQDNSSAIKLKTNGMKSMGQRSKLLEYPAVPGLFYFIF